MPSLWNCWIHCQANILYWRHHYFIQKIEWIITKCMLLWYGKWEVSVNYHFALHIPDLISDYGPPHVYWCFAYERMNGIHSEVPNNSKNIELQIINRIIQQFSIDITAVSQDLSLDEKIISKSSKTTCLTHCKVPFTLQSHGPFSCLSYSCWTNWSSIWLL